MWVFTAAWERSHGEEVTWKLRSIVNQTRMTAGIQLDGPLKLPLADFLYQTYCDRTKNKILNFLPLTTKAVAEIDGSSQLKQTLFISVKSEVLWDMRLQKTTHYLICSSLCFH